MARAISVAMRGGIGVAAVLTFLVLFPTLSVAGAQDVDFDLPDGADLERVDGGWYLHFDGLCGNRTRLMIREDWLGPNPQEGLVLFLEIYFDGAPGIYMTPEECSAWRETELASVEAAAAADSVRCRTVHIVVHEPDVLVERWTCPGDDLWDNERTTQCKEMRLASEDQLTFGCRSIALGADESFLGSLRDP